MGAQQSSAQISPQDLSIVRQETGFSDKEVERLFERFSELDREGKGFLERTFLQFLRFLSTRWETE